MGDMTFNIEQVSLNQNIQCPIGFGDCPDCNYFIGGCCEYEEEVKNEIKT